MSPTGSIPVQSNADMEFRQGLGASSCWRAWSDLEKMERSTGQPFHTVLRLRADQPDQPGTGRDLLDGLGNNCTRSTTLTGY